MLREKNIIVVGDGIAGLALTKRLTEQLVGHEQSSITLIAPAFMSLLSRDNIHHNTRTSAPFIHHAAAEELGLSAASSRALNQGKFGLERRNHLRKVAEKGVEVFGRNYLHTYPVHVIDIEVEKAELAGKLNIMSAENPALHLVEGKVSRLQITGDQVTGIYLENQSNPLNADLVIDATGRPARLIKSLDPNLFQEKRATQPSTTFSGYLDLSNSSTGDTIPEIWDTILVSMIPGGIGASLSPVERMEHSPATHLFLMGGDVVSIRRALQWAQRIRYLESVEHKRFAAMLKLTNGTAWNKILLESKSIDRTVLFTHQEAVYRKPLIRGLTAIGDALGHVNPQSAIGFVHIDQDIRRLLGHLNEHISTLDAVEKYNEEIDSVFSGRFLKSQLLYKASQILHWILGTNEASDS